MAVDSLHDHTGPSPVQGPQADHLTTGTAPHFPKLREGKPWDSLLTGARES